LTDRGAPPTGSRRPRSARPLYFALALALAVGVAAIWLTGVTQRDDRIVFVAEKDGAWDLWWMRGDGSAPARLTTTPLDERAPALSPDRTQIAYSTSDGALWILTTADRKATRLPLDDGARHSNPSWSPDGRQIVFTTYTMSGQGEDATLSIYDVQQKTTRQLLLQDGAQDYARIHPDGRSMVYSSSGAITIFGFGYVVAQQLWTMSLVSGRVEQLLLARGKDTQPAWSPDGRSVAFVSDREGATQLWRAAADGSHVTRLTQGPAASMHPAWSPGSDEIAFVSDDGRASALAVVAASGGESRRFDLSSSGIVNMRDPHWR
jgi:Tol biopolymer transport system component